MVNHTRVPVAPALPPRPSTAGPRATGPTREVYGAIPPGLSQKTRLSGVGSQGNTQTPAPVACGSGPQLLPPGPTERRHAASHRGPRRDAGRVLSAYRERMRGTGDRNRIRERTEGPLRGAADGCGEQRHSGHSARGTEPRQTSQATESSITTERARGTCAGAKVRGRDTRAGGAFDTAGPPARAASKPGRIRRRARRRGELASEGGLLKGSDVYERRAQWG